ncbi:hypothetical protein H0H81_000136 [Sphagnurus paluster]|uniref:Uncharacterized protein n=1 Tax=Sphagnurus paluster TaxID=117069 RepID=A0A9P7FPL8_9AGAR|nr:hypothetical protein H0H81_000136 [Sphagnurus paluster]
MSVTPGSDSVLQISNITIKHDKNLETPEVLIDGHPANVAWTHGNKRKYEAAFSPSLRLGPSQGLSIRWQQHQSLLGRIFSKGNLPKREKKVSAQELSDITEGQAGQKNWHYTEPGLEVKAVFRAQHGDAQDGAYFEQSVAESAGSSLHPLTEDILNTCPRFRILVIGKNVEHNQRGKADINEELISELNERFVLHDSMGFEAGEEKNFIAVQNFIQERNAMRDVKDKLHAVWMCFQVPIAGGRVLETGDEYFLKAKADPKNPLGSVPIIAVFTQYDKLVNSIVLGQVKAKIPGNAREGAPLVAEATFQEKSPAYKSTVQELVELTQNLVVEYISEAGFVTGMAQRTSLEVNIRTSIDVGSRKYWQSIVTGLNLGGKTMEQICRVLHTDIINVWNFYDPKRNLHSDEFRRLIYNLVEDKDGPPEKNTNTTAMLTGGASIIGTIAGFLSGPLLPIVIPILATGVLAAWLIQMYSISRDTLRRLITHIIQLILVMQIIFWLRHSLKLPDTYATSRRLAKLAYAIQEQNMCNDALRHDIEEYTKKLDVTDPKATVDKIVELIDKYRIKNPGDIDATQLENFNKEGDEDWAVTPIASK